MAKDKKESRGTGLKKQMQPLQLSSKLGVTDLIGMQLRKYYDEAANRPVPDRFLNLLYELDKVDSSNKSK